MNIKNISHDYRFQNTLAESCENTTNIWFGMHRLMAFSHPSLERSILAANYVDNLFIDNFYTLVLTYIY